MQIKKFSGLSQFLVASAVVDDKITRVVIVIVSLSGRSFRQDQLGNGSSSWIVARFNFLWLSDLKKNKKLIIVVSDEGSE